MDKICLGVNENDRIGLIGINGAGKSTLLRIVAGLEKADQGELIKGAQVSIEYLSQNPVFDSQATVLEQVLRGSSPVMKLVRDYQQALADPKTPNERIALLSEKMDQLDGWTLESEAKNILTKLDSPDFNADMGSLSGGERKRVALAAALINPSDLLILDEPTNHLDNSTIDWLEQYLNKIKGSLLMVTHDRYFLDRVVNQIIELELGNLYSYKGNFSYYLEKKAERLEIQNSSDNKKQRLLRQELAWIRKGARARTTKQKARIDRYNRLNQDKRELKEESLKISVGSSRLGGKIIELTQVSKAFGQKIVLDNFSYSVMKNDRIGIIGPNGSGKSTLLNIISGSLCPDRGLVDKGETVRIGLYSQEIKQPDGQLRVIEYIRETAEFLVDAAGNQISAAQMLENFLFSPSLQWTEIKKLSGGEQRRLALLKVLMDSPNILLLDEPTNDLDIQTLAVLEDYLENFKGAVLSVSHDRYFLDRMAEKIFFFEGKGRVVQHFGNYSQFRERIEQENFEIQKKSEEAKPDLNHREKRDKPLKLSFNQQKELQDALPAIAELEEKISGVDKKIDLAFADHIQLQQLLQEKDSLEELLQDRMDRWIYLAEIADSLEKNNQ